MSVQSEQMKGAKQMKKYIVYLSTGERVCVEADYYEFRSEPNSLWFYRKRGEVTKEISGFNFDNIQGFCQGYMSEEKEQKY